VFILTEGNLRSDAKDAAAGSLEKWADVAAVFAIVGSDELLPDGTIFDFLGGAFQNDGFVCFFGADDNVRVCGDVPCFARTRTGAEPKRFLPPNSPDKHEMRATIGASRGDPIVVGFFEALERPRPRFETTQVFRGILNGIRPIRPAGFGFDHDSSFSGRRDAAELYQDEKDRDAKFQALS